MKYFLDFPILRNEKDFVLGVAGAEELTIFICFLLKQNCKTAQPIKDINTIQVTGVQL